MFSKLPTGRGATSSEGFCVQRLGSPMTQFIIRYSEGDHVLEYPLENLVPNATDMIVVKRIGPWRQPHQEQTIDDSQKVLIATRICDALAFLGDVVQVVT
jgi:hypothetical protein